MRQIPRPDGEDHERVEAARRGAREALLAQGEQLWLRWTGSEAAVQGRPEAGSDELTPEALASIRLVRDASVDPEERRALEHLEIFVVGKLVSEGTQELEGKIQALLRGATFETGGGEVSFAELGTLLAAEGDREGRARIARDARQVALQLQALEEERDQLLRELAEELGYRDPAHLGEALLGREGAALASLAEQLLDETDSLFRRAFAEAARRELGLSLDELQRADLPRLFRGITFRVRQQREGAKAAVEGTLEELGLKLGGVRGLRIDLEERQAKLQQPACFPIDPPGDVRLSLPPAWATEDWRSIWREVGCALRAAHVEEERFEFRKLGPAATGEAFAQLFEGLAEDPRWLRSHLALAAVELDAQAAGAALLRLFLMRRAAATFLYERERLSGSASGGPFGSYQAAMERAFAFPVRGPGATRFVTDRLGLVGAGEALGTELFAATLASHLERTHGPRWWEVKEAGSALVRLWAKGSRRSPTELIQSLGGESLGVEPLIRRLEERLAPLLLPPPADEEPEAPPPPTPGEEGEGPAVAAEGAAGEPVATLGTP